MAEHEKTAEFLENLPVPWELLQAIWPIDTPYKQTMRKQAGVSRELRQEAPEAFYPLFALPGGGEMPLKTGPGLRAARERGMRPTSVPAFALAQEAAPKPAPVPTPTPPIGGETAEPGVTGLPSGVSLASPPGLDLTGRVQSAQAAGTPIEVMTPTGIVPLAQAPPGEYGGGGYAQFDGGPITLMRAATPEERGPSVAARPTAQQIAANPLEWMQRLEMKMGNEGLHPTQRIAYRSALANMLVKGGFDPGVALMYSQEGLSPQVAQGMSGQFQQEQQAGAQMSRLIAGEALRGKEPPTSIRGGSDAFIKRQLEQAKGQKKKIAIVYEPNGEMTIVPVGTEGLFGGTKRGRLKQYAAGRIPQKEIAIIDARPRQMPLTPPTGLVGRTSPQAPTKQGTEAPSRASKLAQEIIRGM